MKSKNDKVIRNRTDLAEELKKAKTMNPTDRERFLGALALRYSDFPAATVTIALEGLEADTQEYVGLSPAQVSAQYHELLAKWQRKVFEEVASSPDWIGPTT